MIYVVNRSKILSYVVASFTVLFLFAVGTTIIPKQDVDLIKISANVENNNSNNIHNIEE